jgi:hypothetical protein
MPPTVDRSIARMIAFKRIGTGLVSLAFGVAFVVAVSLHGSPPLTTTALGALIFFGGGAWTLRDGLRLRRELLRG